MAVFFLVGNTTIKVACPDAAVSALGADAPAADLAGLLRPFAGQAAGAASVNPAGEKTVEEACAAAGVGRPLYVGRDFPAGVEMAVADPREVGIDRVLNVKAAFARRGGPCAAVDLGTAVSISVADAAGRFVGGAILAGLGLSLRCLHEATAFLPMVRPAVPSSPLGRDTLSAIQSGVVYGTLGAVKEVLARICDALGADIDVFLTGGDCELVAPVCPAQWQVAPALTLEGLRLAYDESR